MNPDILGVFHDGVVEQIVGAVPGSVALRLNIPYLRKMFAGEGKGFILTLFGCTKFEYTEYGEEPTSDIPTIATKQPEILYVTSIEPLVLDCAMGTLELAFKEMEVSLDSGSPVSYEALGAASEKYWSDWEANTRA